MVPLRFSTFLAMAAIGWSGVAHATYGVIDLGTNFSGQGLNEAGIVSGSVGGSAAIWSSGSLIVLPNGNLYGGPVSAISVNAGGVILGTGAGATGSTSPIVPGMPPSLGGVVTWSTPTSAPTLIASSFIGHGGSSIYSAVALDDAGDILYHATQTPGNPMLGTDTSYVWSASSGTATQAVLCVMGGCASSATDMNDSGKVVLNFGGAVGMWQAGSSTMVTSGFTATALNNVGDIVGNTYSGTAMFWNGNLNVSLGSGSAEDVNDAGMVVGQSTDGSALLWAGAGAPAVRLDSLVDPSLGWHFTNALKINNQGEILAIGTMGSSTDLHTVLLRAVPEPATYAVLVAGLGSLLLRRRHPR